MTWKRCGVRSRACPPDFEERLPGEQNTGQVSRTVDLGNLPQIGKEGCVISCGQSSHLLSTSMRAELVGSVFPCGPRMLLCLLLWDCEVQAEILHSLFPIIILNYQGAFVMINELILKHYYLLKFIFYSDFLSSLPRSSNSHVSSGSS